MFSRFCFVLFWGWVIHCRYSDMQTSRSPPEMEVPCLSEQSKKYRNQKGFLILPLFSRPKIAKHLFLTDCSGFPQNNGIYRHVDSPPEKTKEQLILYLVNNRNLSRFCRFHESELPFSPLMQFSLLLWTHLEQCILPC